MWEKYNPALSPVKATFGTWTNGSCTVRVAYFESGHVRTESENNGRVEVLTDEEWLSTLDGLKDRGWYKKSR